MQAGRQDSVPESATAEPSAGAPASGGPFGVVFYRPSAYAAQVTLRGSIRVDSSPHSSFNKRQQGLLKSSSGHRTVPYSLHWQA